MKLKKIKQLALTTSDSYFGDTSKSLFFAGGDKYRIASSLLLYSSPLGVTGRFAGEPLTDNEGLENGNFIFGGNSTHFKCKTESTIKSDVIYILTALEDAQI